MLNGTYEPHFDRNLIGTERAPITIKKTIGALDIAFKNLPPITEDLTVYRSIAKPPSFFKDTCRLFDKSIKIKPGETMVMRAYPYCSPDIEYARAFRGDEGSILYEIILPKGTKVSQGRAGYMGHYGDYVLPRHSQFRCISNEVLERDGTHLIKLEYILPNEPWRK